MPARKIVDEQEVLRWFEEGRTYEWMCEQYRDKYGIDTVPSLWGNFRRRRGLTRRIAWDDDLIPWRMEDHHRLAYPVAMLRLEARRRAGYPLSDDKVSRLSAWRDMLNREGKVVDYSPEVGFVYVDRQPEDADLIRKPASAMLRRRAAE